MNFSKVINNNIRKLPEFNFFVGRLPKMAISSPKQIQSKIALDYGVDNVHLK